MTGTKVMLLLSAMLDKNYDVLLKFYDPKTGTILKRRYDYDEYCYADPAYDKMENISKDKYKTITKINPVTDKELEITQVFTHGWSFAKQNAATNETNKSGNQETENETSPLVWEYDVKAYESYLHDMDLTVGLYYDVSGRPRQVQMPVPENVETELKKILESKESGQFTGTFERLGTGIEPANTPHTQNRHRHRD